MLTPIVTSFTYRFPEETADYETKRPHMAMETTDDDVALYADFWANYSTEAAFDIVVPDTDIVTQRSPSSTALLTFDQTLSFDEELLLMSSTEDFSEKQETKIRNETFNEFNRRQKASDAETKMEAESMHFSPYLPTYQLRISQTCRELNIVNNPLLWTDQEVRSWCDWALNQYQVHPTRREMLLSHLHHNGIGFSLLEEKDFVQLFHSAGGYIYSELELWKNAATISSASITSPNLMSTDSTAAANVASTAQSSTNLAASTNLVSTNLLPTDIFLTNYIISADPTTAGATSIAGMSTALTLTNSTLTDSASTSPESTNSILSWSTIPTFVLDSVLNDDCPYEDGNGSTETPNAFTDSETDGSQQSHSGYFTDMGSADSQRSSIHKTKSEGDLIQSSDEWHPYAKHGHQLWQFLHELLQKPSNYDDCIRWIDRRQGIFKIEDSVRVAKLWGERKNRPAMNYDKLSRSIRQYYKKGIIKKTNQSKRLVYQFCPKYNT